MFEIIRAKRRILKDLCWVIMTLCTQNEANAFSFWDWIQDTKGYILEYRTVGIRLRYY
jgi:hypothetical protein